MHSLIVALRKQLTVVLLFCVTIDTCGWVVAPAGNIALAVAETQLSNGHRIESMRHMHIPHHHTLSPLNQPSCQFSLKCIGLRTCQCSY